MYITTHQAIKRMKELSDIGVSFSFTYQTLNNTKGSSKGFKTVKRAVLRKSIRDDKSELSNQLISYVDIDNKDVPRQFYLCLLLRFNEFTIKQ
jgi:hypothetical protein